MTNPSNHPSYLALDRVALGQVDSPQTALHVADCVQCRGHVEMVRSPLPLPAWAQNGRLARRPRRTLAWAAGVAAMAAAACLALWLPHTPYVGVKGAPSVAVHVDHHGSVQLWTGQPLEAGDAIRLEVVPQEFEYTSVFALTNERLAPLYTGKLKPHEHTLLPKAWRLDQSPEPEQLVVIFSRARLSDQATQKLLQAHDTSDGHAVRLILSKRAP